MFFDIVKIPSEVEAVNIRVETNFPSKVGSEKIKITIINSERMIVDSFL